HVRPAAHGDRNGHRPARAGTPAPARGRATVIGVRGTGLLGGGLASIAPLLHSPRFEVFPAGGVEDAVAEWLAPGTTVTVTASPAKGLDATLDLTERLAGRGYRVVPHVSARLVADGAHLADLVARPTPCGGDAGFVPAGDRRPPGRGAGRAPCAAAPRGR